MHGGLFVRIWRAGEKYDNLWLDTTMAIGEYFSIKGGINLGSYRPDRVMYGSDFPNIEEAGHLLRCFGKNNL